ncbi:hypothetical protein K525DRAFT_191041 [Schizophyllum commune Loenen D]|nr:hypothetical protein K525DRAFT_191041 [Schizophyllum commune Loenen D]
MYFKSTINSETKSSKDVPVTLFACNGKRLFMPRPTNFVTMEAAVRKKFHLNTSAALEFTTSTLDICRGAPVFIDEDVYETMSSFLDEIVVTVVDSSALPPPQPSPRSVTTGKSSEKKVSLPKGTTTAGKSASASRERSVFEDDDEDEAPAVDEDIPPAAAEPEVVDAEPAFPVPEPRAKEQSSSRGSSQQWVEVPPSSAVVVEAEVEVQSSSVKTVKAETAAAASSPANLFDDDEPEEPTPPPRSQPSPSKFRPAAAQKSGIPTTSKPTSSSSQSRKPSAKTVAAKPSSGKSKPSEERFTVHISGQYPDQEAEFKTRGGHLVKKVLAGACQNFGIDVDEARLYHIIQYEDDNGDMLEDEVECDPEDTMQKCGIEAGAKLVIKVDSEEYDDDE